MKCDGCFDEIECSDSYFSGSWVPESNEKDGSRKFGCSPQQNYCKRCIEHMPTFFNQPERSKREDRLETALNLNHEIVKVQLSSGCGALNIVETQ